MDAELKARWVAALRSGDYRQTRMMLEDEDKGFCCLGVLCQVSGRATRGVEIESSYQWIKTIIGEKAYQKLIELNDADLARFPIIADYIEAKL